MNAHLEARRAGADLGRHLVKGAGPNWRVRRHVSARAVRLGVAGLDGLQTLAIGSAASAAMPSVHAGFGLAGTLGTGLLAAVVAAAVRLATRSGASSGAESFAASSARAASATVIGTAVIGLECLLVIPSAVLRAVNLVGWLVLWAVLAGGASAALRYGAGRLALARSWGRRILLVGQAPHTAAVADAMTGEPHPGWQLAGTVDITEPGGMERLNATVERDDDLVVVVVADPGEHARLETICERLEDSPGRVSMVLRAPTPGRRQRGLASLGDFFFVDVVADPHGELGGAAKRAIDIMGAVIALLLLAPLLAVVALAIRAGSPGPALFRQRRFGIGSRSITVFKFRTMHATLGDATGARATAARDPRVTRLGRLLRRTSIDELPQLLNVLRGDMSLVGPRPHPLHMRVGDAYYFEAVRHYRARHRVRPGITGWAQVNGSRGAVDTLAKARRRVELDLWYIDNWSVWWDLRILLMTALAFISPYAD